MSSGDNGGMSGDNTRMPSLENARDLEAAMGLVRGLVSNQRLTPSVLESHLGWSKEKLDEWLEKPSEARLEDYLRLLRLAAALIFEGKTTDVERRPAEAEGRRLVEPDLLESIFEAGAYRHAIQREPTFGTEDVSDLEASRPLRLMDLHITAILAAVETGQLSAAEVIEAIRGYENELQKAKSDR